jgi:hypothetical protein
MICDNSGRNTLDDMNNSSLSNRNEAKSASTYARDLTQPIQGLSGEHLRVTGDISEARKKQEAMADRKELYIVFMQNLRCELWSLRRLLSRKL